MNRQTQKQLLDIVKNNYTQIAREFDQTRQKKIWSELASLTKNVKDNDKILDVGCGNGRLFELFKNKKISYLGTDGSTELIKLAKENQLKKNSKVKGKAQFRVNDILELNKIREVNFDYVFCAAVLHHLPGSGLQVKALRQLRNKIKSDGKIILTVWNLWAQPKYRKLILRFAILKFLGKNKMDFGDILFDWKNSSGKALSQRYYHAFSKKGLKKIIKKSGLRIEKLQKDRYNYYLVLSK